MIALVIIVLAGAFASGYISRGIVDRAVRAGSMPAASRRAIRRDRRRARLGLASVPGSVLDRPVGCRCGWGLGECRMCLEARTGRPDLAPLRVLDPLEDRLTDAIGKLGGPPPQGWQAGVWQRLCGGRRRG